MEKYKPYDKYKDSEIAWLGKVPEHWEIKRIKYIFGERDQRSENGSEELLSVSHYTGITKKSSSIKNGELITNASSLAGYKIVKEGDLVMNIMLAWNGSLGISKFDGITSPAYCVFKSKIGGERFFGYIFRTKNAQQEFKKQSTGIIDSRLRLYPDKFFNIKTIIPTKSEQTAIANFLDYKTRKIDRFIRKKKQLIKLLNEQKAGIINRAVTRGIDPNTPLRPSGIEWLGDIPKHWEVRKLKYVVNQKLKYGANEPGGDFHENDPRYIRITDFDKSGKLRQDTFCSLKKELANPFLLTNGDILFARSGGTVGKTFQFKNYNGLACYAGYLIKAEPNEDIIMSDYLFQFTCSGIYDIWKNYIFNKATIENIGADKYCNLLVVIPPLPEQQAIVAYIETETAQIDKTIATIEREIALVQEYRTTLIAEAVTGKIDVRHYVVPLSETTDQDEEFDQENDVIDDTESETNKE